LLFIIAVLYLFFGASNFYLSPSSDQEFVVTLVDPCDNNNICDGLEDCSNCPSDCGVCPFCGDDNCDASEGCSSCPADCGVCTPPSDDNGGGGGGGGGGDTPPPACVPNCLGKICGDDGCGGSCGICEDDIIIDVDITKEGNDTIDDSSEIIKPKNLLLNFITGLSFIYRLILIIIIIILIIIIIFLIWRRRRKSKSKERKIVEDLSHTIKRERNRYPTKKVKKK